MYEEAAKKYGNTNIPVNTFNKVWIVPEKAVVYENAKAGTAYVVESRLKVMLEADYLSMSKHGAVEAGAPAGQIGQAQGPVPTLQDQALGSLEIGVTHFKTSLGDRHCRKCQSPLVQLRKSYEKEKE